MTRLWVIFIFFSLCFSYYSKMYAINRNPSVDEKKTNKKSYVSKTNKQKIVSFKKTIPKKNIITLFLEK